MTETADLVRRIYAAFNNRDVERRVTIVTDDVALLDDPARMPSSTTGTSSRPALMVSPVSSRTSGRWCPNSCGDKSLALAARYQDFHAEPGNELPAIADAAPLDIASIADIGAFTDAQREGTLSGEIPRGDLLFLLIAIAAW